MTLRRGSSLMLRTRALRILCGWDKAVPYRTLRVGSSPPHEREHICMTALSRSAPWTGVSACCSTRARVVESQPSSTASMRQCTISWCVPLDEVCYTQNLNSLFHGFSPCQAAHRIARTLLHTLICFERVESKFCIRLSTPYRRRHAPRPHAPRALYVTLKLMR